MTQNIKQKWTNNKMRAICKYNSSCWLNPWLNPFKNMHLMLLILIVFAMCIIALLLFEYY